MKHKYDVGDLIYDAQIYDGMNNHVDDLAFYKKWMPVGAKKKILELCCGSGRLTIPLVKEGFQITGVDFTANMLTEAREKAKQANISVNLIEEDIRLLDLKERFDLVFIPFNSIHHLYSNDDLFKVLNVVKRHMKEDGRFILDCFNPNIQYIVNSEKGEAEVASFTTKDGRNILVKQTMQYESKTQVNRIKWKYHVNGRFHSIQNLDMRMYFPQELDCYLNWAGFDTIKKFGSFEEEEFTDNSNKQIFVCKASHIDK